MISESSQFFAILTEVGEAKQAKANALGVPWSFAEMGVGDANGTDPVPDRKQTRLLNERRRAALNQVKIDPLNSSVIIAEQVIPPDVGGWWIREISLYDTDGDLVAIANCAPSFKPLLSQNTGKTTVVRLNIVVTSAANVELKIDPSVVVATRDYVDQAIISVSTLVQEAVSKKLVQATEQVMGLAKIATQPQVGIGEDDTTIVTPKKLAVPLKTKAPVNSPTFTGTPRAPKAAQFDSSDQIITAEALREAGVQYKDIPTRDITGANLQLTVEDVGRTVLLGGNGGGTAILPKASEVPTGKLIAVRGVNAKGTTNKIRVTAGDDLNGHFNEGIYAGVLRFGESVVFVSGGLKTWVAMSESTYNFIAQAVSQQFIYGQSFGLSGYQQYPGGLIKQWGVYTYTASGIQSLSAPLPISFPTAIMSGIATSPSRLNNTSIGVDVSASTKTSLSIASITSNGSGVSTVFFEAWGY